MYGRNLTTLCLKEHDPMPKNSMKQSTTTEKIFLSTELQLSLATIFYNKRKTFCQQQVLKFILAQKYK